MKTNFSFYQKPRRVCIVYYSNLFIVLLSIYKHPRKIFHNNSFNYIICFNIFLIN